MLGFFKSPTFNDATLGTFTRSGGLWRGSIALADGKPVPLLLSGGRAEPDAEAIAEASKLAARFVSWRPTIETALFDHYGPYAESAGDGTTGEADSSCPVISAAHEVWPHATLVHVSITPLAGVMTTELGYTTAWDQEHTLGARFRSQDFLELCGSV
jgi:hypothetical protein